LSHQQWLDLAMACATVIVTVGLVVALKIFANIPIGNVASDLNLLTYGFLWDTILKAMYGNYWQKLSPDLQSFKPLMLFFVIVLNFVLMLWNIKISYNLELSKLQGTTNKNLKIFSYVIGMFSLMIFFVIKIYAE